MKAPAKRTYRVVEVEAADAGFAVTLDGRPVRTPAGTPLALPGRALANAVADEWRAQEDEIRPHTMLLSRLAGTAIDRMGRERSGVVETVVRYADTDLLCYRAGFPRDLAERQQASWQPLLDWAAERHGATLRVTTGVAPVDQPRQAVESLRRAVEALDDLELTSLASTVAACGSLVIALALAAGRLDAEEAFAASWLDETYQSEKWGEDEETAARGRVLHDDIHAAAAFLALAREV